MTSLEQRARELIELEAHREAHWSETVSDAAINFGRAAKSSAKELAEAFLRMRETLIKCSMYLHESKKPHEAVQVTDILEVWIDEELRR